MSIVWDAMSAALLVTGSSLTLIAAVGLFRLPDAYGRIHVVTKPATLGVVTSVCGAALQVPLGPTTAKLALAVAFQFWTIPAASHLLVRSARRSGSRPARADVVDESPQTPTDPAP